MPVTFDRGEIGFTGNALGQQDNNSDNDSKDDDNTMIIIIIIVCVVIGIIVLGIIVWWFFKGGDEGYGGGMPDDMGGPEPGGGEAFLDEGEVSLPLALRELQRAGFAGPVRAGQPPGMIGDAAWGHKGRAFDAGYLRAVLQVLG